MNRMTNRLCRVSAASAGFAMLVAMPATGFSQAPPPAVDILKADIDAVMAAPDGGADSPLPDSPPAPPFPLNMN